MRVVHSKPQSGHKTINDQLQQLEHALSYYKVSQPNEVEAIALIEDRIYDLRSEIADAIDEQRKWR